MPADASRVRQLLPSGPEQDLRACVDLMRGGSRTFFAASRLLPPRVRNASIALYAFCRVADDLVDEGDDVQASLAQLAQRLDAIYAGHPQPFIEDRALALVVQQHRLPRPLLDALLEGFAWDAQGRRYHTLEDVHDYAARVAGSVGAMMCWLMGVRQAHTLARACELGVAMQLTNIARDVGTDARMGRLYLPRQWLAEAGLNADRWLANPHCTPALQSVVERLLQEADQLYERATQGIADLPADCRRAILAARLIYAEIGQELRRNGLNPINRRAVVSGRRKAWLLGRAWLAAPWAGRKGTAPASLGATAYLVSACASSSHRPAQALSMSRPLGERAAWMLELFERQAMLRRQR